MKKILIPTDFSRNAFNALKYAFELFKNEACEFHIIHTYFLAGYSTENLLIPEPDDAEYERVRANAEANMEKLKVKLVSEDLNPKHRLHFFNEMGPLIDILKNKIKKENITLIVMGTRGETEGEDFAYGRNSVIVMEKVRSCPVLAVPQNIVFTGLKEIVFPSSFKHPYNLEELQMLVNIAKTSKSVIRIVHAGEENDLSEKQLHNIKILENHFHELHYSFQYLKNVKIPDGLFRYVDEHSSSMIAFVNKKHWFFGSVFSNPLVKKLGIHSEVPLLALHDSSN